MIGERSARGTRLLSVSLTILTWVFLALGLLLLPLYFVSYAQAKAFFYSHMAMHGAPQKTISYLTEEAYNRFFDRLPIAGEVLELCGITLALFKNKLTVFLLSISSEWTGFRNSVRSQFQGGAETTLELSGVFSVLVIGIFLRVWHLGRAVRYDEAGTYIDFASKSLVRGLSNYEAPNNHLLNTLFVHFSTHLFGNTMFGLRFPALAAGCLVIVASWFVTRALYGPLAGILAAGSVAALPTFIEFSINGRGYSLQWLFILAVMWFAIVLRKNPSLRIAWLGLVLAAVAGMYSIPTTLLAIVGVFGWMLVSTPANETANTLKSLSRNIALAGLPIGLLSILLYLPPLLVSGPQALMAKAVTAWQQPEFVEGAKHLGECAWVYWTEGVPAAALWILIAGLVIGLVFHRRVGDHRVSMTIALCIVAVIFSWTRHVFAFPRVWSYLLLSAVITASAGLSLILTLLVKRSRISQIMIAGLMSIVLALFVGSEVVKQHVLFTSTETGTIIDADQIVDFLSASLRPGDSLVSNAIINYELLRHNPTLYGSLAKPQEAARVVAVVAKETSPDICKPNEMVALLNARNTAGTARLAEKMDLDTYTPPQVQAKFLTSTVYSFELKKKPTETSNESSPSN